MRATSKPVGLVEHDLAAVVVDADADVNELLEPFAHLFALFRLNEEHHEAAAAGAQQLAADCAGFATGLVDLVELWIRYAVGQFALQPPPGVKKFAKLAQRHL